MCYTVTMSKTTAITVRLDPDDRAELEKIARREDRSLGYIIRLAISRYLKENS
jgi:predicted transcriptional regulator